MVVLPTPTDAELTGDAAALACKWVRNGFKFAHRKFPRLRRRLGAGEFDQHVWIAVWQAARLFDPAVRPMFSPLMKQSVRHALLKAAAADRKAKRGLCDDLTHVRWRGEAAPDQGWVDAWAEALPRLERLTPKQRDRLLVAATNDALSDRAAAAVARVPVADMTLVRRRVFRRPEDIPCD
jgi:hypothetical protein